MKKIAILSVAYALFLGGCATSPKPAQVAWDKVKPIEFQAKTQSQIPDDHANLIFFREADGKNEQTAVNIGINGRYHASLLGGNYTTTPSCAYSTNISTQVTGRKINDLNFQPSEYRFNEGQNYYFQVSVDDSYVATATPVDPDSALERLKDKQLQSHTISRVSLPNCPDIPPPPEPEPAPEEPDEKLVLKDLYLFDFDIRKLDSDEKAQAIDFANKVKDADIDNYQMYISGYADPMGTNEYNDKLASDRANHVAGIYRDNGIPIDKIILESFGELLPLVDCSQIQNREDRIECNHQNRRVRVEVTEQ